VQLVLQRGAKSRVVLIFFAVGLSVRLLVGLHGGLNTAPLPGSDDREYDSYAWNVAQGHGYRGISPDVRGVDGQLLDHPTAYRSPGTSLLWAALFRIFGHRYDAVRIAGCVLDAAIILLLHEIGRLCFSETVALVAAALYVLWPTALFYSTQLGSEAPYAFFSCSFILAALEFGRRPDWIRAVVAGLLLGLSLLTRGNAVMLVALVIPWSLWQFRKAPRLLVRGVVIPVIALAALVPWTVRNYKSFHSFIPFETGGGDVLLGSYNRVVANDPHYYGYWVYATSNLPEYRAQITDPNDEVARDHVELHLAIEWIRNHPETWWYLVESRFRRSWTPFLESSSPPLYRVGMIISWGPILVLFSFAFFPTIRNFLQRNHPGSILHLGILHFMLTTLVFWGSSRFRYPVEGLCLLLASTSVVWAWDHQVNGIHSRSKIPAELTLSGSSMEPRGS